MMKVVWSPKSQEIVGVLFNWYKTQFGISTANKVKKSIRGVAALLKDNPAMGKIESELSNREKTYRSFVEHKNHKIVYYIDDETIYITDIWTCKMNH